MALRGFLGSGAPAAVELETPEGGAMTEPRPDQVASFEAFMWNASGSSQGSREDGSLHLRARQIEEALERERRRIDGQGKGGDRRP